MGPKHHHHHHPPDPRPHRERYEGTIPPPPPPLPHPVTHACVRRHCPELHGPGNDCCRVSPNTNSGGGGGATTSHTGPHPLGPHLRQQPPPLGALPAASASGCSRDLCRRSAVSRRWLSAVRRAGGAGGRSLAHRLPAEGQSLLWHGPVGRSYPVGPSGSDLTPTPPLTFWALLGGAGGAGVLGELGPVWGPRYPKTYLKMTPSLHCTF